MSLLITGGTGSFGRAYVAHALADGADRICIYSRGEHAQADMRAAFGDDGRLRWFIGDVRDRDRLRRAMEGCYRVVHAAALKRIEVSEYDPLEVVKTNITGAANVIEAAMDAGVKKVIGLSTDKAWNPINVYGATKLVAEKMFLAANNMRGVNGPIFSVCRYGNIAGSNGSVIPRWRQALETSGTVPTTNPECTRFYMKIDQAVRLVSDTLETMRGGELVIPTLPAYRLGDLADAMGAKMKIIGLPDHEKLHEGMADGNTSDAARRMTVTELRHELLSV